MSVNNCIISSPRPAKKATEPVATESHVDRMVRSSLQKAPTDKNIESTYILVCEKGEDLYNIELKCVAAWLRDAVIDF